MSVGSCLLSNEQTGMAEGMINRRIEGKSWGEIADEFGFPNPGAARKGFTKLTGITDYKIKGKELQDLVNKGLLDTIKGTVEKKAKKAVTAVDDALKIAQKGPGAFDFESYKVNKVLNAEDHLSLLQSDPMNPTDLVHDVTHMTKQGHGYLAITQKTGATFADVDNIVWNQLVKDNGGDLWKAYVSKPTSENGFKAVKEMVFDLRGKGLTAQEIADLAGVDKNVVKMIVDGNWSLPQPGSTSYIGKIVHTPTSTYTGSSSFSGSYNGQKFIPSTDIDPPVYGFQWEPSASTFTTNYPTKTISEMDDWHNSLGHDLTAEERRAISRYIGGDMPNNYLRGKTSYFSEDLKNQWEALDSAMRPLPEPQQVFRGVDSRAFQGEDPRTMVGTTYTDHGYLSTTNELGAGFTRKEIVLVIDLPAGTPARWFMPYAGGLKHEQEILLGRGMDFIIKKTEDKGRQIFVYMEAILT